MVAVTRIVGELNKAVTVVDGDGQLAEDRAAKKSGDFHACTSAEAGSIERIEIIVLLADAGEFEKHCLAE